jgi:hypothetical protein
MRKHMVAVWLRLGLSDAIKDKKEEKEMRGRGEMPLR